jgi:threonine dehydrogenase-like Zn-dependent dehydrogenase
LDDVFECSGSAAGVRNALHLTPRGGTLVLLGIHRRPVPVDLLDVVLAEKRIVGSSGHIWDEDVITALRLIEDGHVQTDPIVSRVVSLADAPSAITSWVAGVGRPVKLMVAVP